MKLLVDMALSPELSRWLREQGYEAAHASEMGLDRAPDREILRVAANSQQIVVTADLDFPRLLASLGNFSPGIVLIRGGNHSEGESRECQRRVLAAVSAEDLARSIIVVDRQKIRRRSLPL